MIGVASSTKLAGRVIELCVEKNESKTGAGGETEGGKSGKNL